MVFPQPPGEPGQIDRHHQAEDFENQALDVGTQAVPRPIAYLIGLSGRTYLVHGMGGRIEGFSENAHHPDPSGLVPTLAWMIWLVVVAWRMPDSDASRTP